MTDCCLGQNILTTAQIGSKYDYICTSELFKQNIKKSGNKFVQFATIIINFVSVPDFYGSTLKYLFNLLGIFH